MIILEKHFEDKPNDRELGEFISNFVFLKGYAIAGMEYEEYVDVKKDRLKGLTYDQILTYLKSAKKEDRLKKYKELLNFRNIPFEADLFTWHNEEL